MAPNQVENSLQNAVDNNDYYAVKALLENGADPNTIDSDENCPFWDLQYPPDDLQDAGTRLGIAKLFLEHGADPNLKCDLESLYDSVMYDIFNDMSDPDWDYLLEFYKLLVAYGGGGHGYPRPVLSETIDKARVDDYKIVFEQCEDGYHIQGYIVDPEGKEIGTL